MTQPPPPAGLPADQIHRGDGASSGPPAAPRRGAGARVLAVIVTLAVVGALVLAAVLALGGDDEPAPTATPTAAPPATATTTATPSPTDTAAYEAALVLLRAEPRRLEGDPYAKGAVDAPMVLVEFADYRCPFCARHAQQVDPQLQRYVDDGTLRVEWRDLPIFGEESVPVHVAARAAAQQGRFWEFHDAVFAATPLEGHRSWSPEELDALAAEVGVPDLERFRADRVSPELAAEVEADRVHAVEELGITATPGFILGDSFIPGAYPLQTFVDLIEAGPTRP